jgi:hypothetical protein
MVMVAAQSAVPAQTASAATSKTVVITEAILNQYISVASTSAYTISKVYVDMQAGQLVVTATFTPRKTGKTAATSYATVSTWKVNVVNGRLDVALVSASANGKPASQELLTVINTALKSALNSAINTYLQQKLGVKYTVQSVTISADSMKVVATTK